jgi:hypothetical protein
MQPGDRTDRSEPIGKLIRRKEQLRIVPRLPVTRDRVTHRRHSVARRCSPRRGTARCGFRCRGERPSAVGPKPTTVGADSRHGMVVASPSQVSIHTAPARRRRGGTADVSAVPADRDRSVDQVGDRMTNLHRNVPDLQGRRLRYRPSFTVRGSPYGQPVDTLPRRFGRASVAAVTARTAGPSEASCRSATCLIPSLPG